MLGKFFECEANKFDKYYRVIHTIKEYNDGRRFPIDEIVESDLKVDVNATDLTKMGDFVFQNMSIYLDGLLEEIPYVK